MVIPQRFEFVSRTMSVVLTAIVRRAHTGCTEGSCIAPSAYPCANPDDPEDFTSKLGQDCSFDYDGVTYSGACFGTGTPAVCLDTCNPSPLDGSEASGCANSNNICQSTGLIGDPATVHVCIPTNSGCETVNDLPKWFIYLRFGCLRSAKCWSCLNPDDPTDFSSTLGSIAPFEYLGGFGIGKCFGTGDSPPSCLDTCDPINNVGCFNEGSVCQASGILGDPTTVSVFVAPSSLGCVEDSDCPSGTHNCIDGDRCVAIRLPVSRHGRPIQLHHHDWSALLL